MRIKELEKKPLDSLLKNIPALFPQRTISIQDFNERMSQPVRLSLNKQESFELVKELKSRGYVDWQPNKGRLLFRR
jgi:hypothetical protein